MRQLFHINNRRRNAPCYLLLLAVLLLGGQLALISHQANHVQSTASVSCAVCLASDHSDDFVSSCQCSPSSVLNYEITASSAAPVLANPSFLLPTIRSPPQTAT
jgi:hypothetical protein